MAADGVAALTMKYNDLREAFEFVLRSSRTSRARVIVGYDGQELILLRARSSARVLAVGCWPGTPYRRPAVETNACKGTRRAAASPGPDICCRGAAGSPFDGAVQSNADSSAKGRDVEGFAT